VSIAVALLLAAAPAAVPDPGSEIVVIARKLKTWRGNLQQVDGKLVCRTRRSTGDTAIDAIGCDGMLACYAPLQPQLDAIAASNLRRAEKNRRMETAARSAIPCLDTYHDGAIDRLAAQRAAQ
jgi:hypothetical protein